MIRVDTAALLDFENGLNPARPEKSATVPKILGYGEISSTFLLPSMPDVAFKRMPPFPGPKSIDEYQRTLDNYCGLLKNHCGVNVSEYIVHKVQNRFGEWIVYLAQPRLARDCIGNARICGDEHGRDSESMIKSVCRCLINIWRHNRDHAPERSLGIDGQISNWGFTGANDHPVYFDITTPMLRINGKDLLDSEIFLKSCPPGLAWLVRWRFLSEVLDRYHDTRLVLIDLAANLYKEGCGEKIPAVIGIINRSLADNGAAVEIPFIETEEVRRYYKNDAFIWSFFLNLRRMDRFIRTRVLRGRYNFILPGRISR